MKIRTDFVTNSSSSNFVTINIKNPKLAEIVRTAKIHKKSEESDDDDYDDDYNDYYGHRLDVDEEEQLVKLSMEITDMLDHYNEDKADFPNIGYPPEKLSGLSNSLIGLLKKVRRHAFRGYDFAKIYSALEENSEDILADTESVDWTYDAEGYGEANLFSWFWALSKYVTEMAGLDYRPSSAGLHVSFHYDKENGESQKEKGFYSDPYEDDSDTLDDWELDDDEEDEDDWDACDNWANWVNEINSEDSSDDSED